MFPFSSITFNITLKNVSLSFFSLTSAINSSSIFVLTPPLTVNPRDEEKEVHWQVSLVIREPHSTSDVLLFRFFLLGKAGKQYKRIFCEDINPY